MKFGYKLLLFCNGDLEYLFKYNNVLVILDKLMVDFNDGKSIY